MATRDVTPATLALADLFLRHRELALAGMTKLEASQRCGFKGDSTYRNIEAGREVSLSSYRQAARKLGLPGGERRVDAIFHGEPDPGPSLGVANPVAFHPAVDEERAQHLEVLSQLVQVVERLDGQVSDLNERLSRLETVAPAPARQPVRRKSR